MEDPSRGGRRKDKEFTGLQKREEGRGKAMENVEGVEAEKQRE